jgi:uncharacterized protein YjbJ (UPF0337 family)
MADRWSDTEPDPAEPDIDPVSAQTSVDSTAAIYEEGPLTDAASGASSDSGLSSAVDTARSEANKVTETAKEQVGQVAGEAGRQARNLLDETRAQLRSQAKEQADRISVTLSDLANELRGMADNAPDPSSSVANLVGDGARRLEDFATHLQAGGLDAVMDDLKAMARRRPGAFLAGAAAAGVVVGRLFRNVDLSQQTSGGDGFPATSDSPTSPTGLTNSGVTAPAPEIGEALDRGDVPRTDIPATSTEPEAGSGW